ncbi:hypothetical protein PVAP13_4NG064956 [Panicum virgatum]|uniref:Uncharacterized protein n=1 Tax=Panicum virgatum TaxID=38727 RepID=A0A8T0T8I1_PANVG|nr:hypothetical protein PVAP13_4NG064956 [Panicum virgatum]
MKLDVKPPPQVASTDDQLRLADLQRAFARLEARVVETCGICGEIIVAIDAVAANVREIRRLRAEGLGAELAAPVREVEWAFANLSVLVSRVAAMRGTAVEMGRIRIVRSSGDEAADALAVVLQRIHIGLCQ